MEIAHRSGRAEAISSVADGKSKIIVGSIRINPKSYTDAFINNPDGGPDIYIMGSQARNAAMDGDVVQVQLNHPSKWKLNLASIAARWDDWSEHLLPIIDAIERDEELQRLTLDNASPDSDETPNGTTNGVTGAAMPNRRVRSKRSVSNEKDPAGQAVTPSKVPSNLPSGISKLQIDKIIELPFASKCIQKTGVVVEIIKKNHSGIAGGMLRPFSPTLALFSPIDSRVPRMLIDNRECPLDFTTQADRYKNVLFIARMIEWDGTKPFAKGSLVRIVGDCNKVQSRMEALLLEHMIYDEDFPREAYDELNYLKQLPENWFAKNSAGRRDLTNECVFTIDPKTARDLDDAVSIKQIGEQIYEVGVHIADVSYFVKELTAVDYHARLRTTSVYLVDRVIPMLPRILCEEMCSLNPGEPKLTFSVIWKMDKYGRIVDQWFGRTVIKSCVKLAYEQVQDILNAPNDISWIQAGVNMPELNGFEWKTIAHSCVLLNRIAQNMRSKRFQDGALKIEQVKLKYELDQETGYPTGFSLEKRSDANFLIEEYMLLANMSVARRIYDHNKQMAFLRRHPSSSGQILNEVKEFCEAKGYPMDITSAGSLQRSLNAIKDPTTSKVVSFLLLRAMKNAEYVCTGALPDDDDGFRHFALNCQFYTHFTSPIRRYADVIVHRQLSIALGYEQKTNEDVSSLSQMADECTKRKISSKIISDSSQKLYFNLFVQRAGFCELLACVTRINDQSFDVILIDYDRTGRVYLDKLKPQLQSVKFESVTGIKRLVLDWKPPPAGPSSAKKSKKSKLKNKIGASREDEQNSRADLETSRVSSSPSGMSINEAINNRQIIQVFDVVKLIVTVEDKDITQLKLNLKTPSQ